MPSSSFLAINPDCLSLFRLTDLRLVAFVLLSLTALITGCQTPPPQHPPPAPSSLSLPSSEVPPVPACDTKVKDRRLRSLWIECALPHIPVPAFNIHGPAPCPLHFDLVAEAGMLVPAQVEVRLASCSQQEWINSYERTLTGSPEISTPVAVFRHFELDLEEVLPPISGIYLLCVYSDSGLALTLPTIVYDTLVKIAGTLVPAHAPSLRWTHLEVDATVDDPGSYASGGIHLLIVAPWSGSQQLRLIAPLYRLHTTYHFPPQSSLQIEAGKTPRLLNTQLLSPTDTTFIADASRAVFPAEGNVINYTHTPFDCLSDYVWIRFSLTDFREEALVAISSLLWTALPIQTPILLKRGMHLYIYTDTDGSMLATEGSAVENRVIVLVAAIDEQGRVLGATYLSNQ